MRNLVQKLLSVLSDWRTGVFGPRQVVSVDTAFQSHPFFTDHQRKTEKLASLARYIEGAGQAYRKAVAQKKRNLHILQAIESAQRERLEIETGRRVWNGSAWVAKGGV